MTLKCATKAGAERVYVLDLPGFVRLVPPKILNLEQAIEFVNDDELVEVTPKSIRLRKKILKANQR